jgi:hypothetical protein
MALMTESVFLPEWSEIRHPVIGMLHALALPGAPGYAGSLDSVETALWRDAEALAAGGVNGLLLENFGDAPFYPGPVPAHTVAHLTALAAGLRRRFPLPLGINVLRNDGCAALAIAQAVGASFIRVNVLCGARLTDQGVLQGIAHELLRLRAVLGARNVKILADVGVKHSAPLASYPLAEEVADAIERGGADALVVTGSATGKAAAVDDLEIAKAAAGATPVFVGSGVTPESVADYLPRADGFIVGTAFKKDGVTRQPVDRSGVEALMARVRSLR